MIRNMFLLCTLLCFNLSFHIFGTPLHNPPDQKTIAMVNGEPITLEQLESEVVNKRRELEKQFQEIENSILSRMIDNKLLIQEANSHGISLEEYIAKNVTNVSVVTDAEVQNAYEKSKQNFPGSLPAEAKYGIRRSLENNAWGKAYQDLVSELRKNATIENYFVFSNMTRTDIEIGDSPVVGASDAKVTIFEFSDFECPYSRLQQKQIKQLLETYSDNIRLVFKHFPLPRHKNAFISSKAAFCAQQQAQFWDFHFNLFRKEQDLGMPSLTQLVIDQGLDNNLFTGCMNDPKTEERINADIQTGLKAGVKGTPTFFVNGKKIESPAGLESAIKFELNQK